MHHVGAEVAADHVATLPAQLAEGGVLVVLARLCVRRLALARPVCLALELRVEDALFALLLRGGGRGRVARPIMTLTPTLT